MRCRSLEEDDSHSTEQRLDEEDDASNERVEIAEQCSSRKIVRRQTFFVLGILLDNATTQEFQVDSRNIETMLRESRELCMAVMGVGLWWLFKTGTIQLYVQSIYYVNCQPSATLFLGNTFIVRVLRLWVIMTLLIFYKWQHSGNDCGLLLLCKCNCRCYFGISAGRQGSYRHSFPQPDKCQPLFVRSGLCRVHHHLHYPRGNE